MIKIPYIKTLIISFAGSLKRSDITKKATIAIEGKIVSNNNFMVKIYRLSLSIKTKKYNFFH